MSSRKYPLDPLIKLRERQVEDATRDAAVAVRERQTAELARIAAENERLAADEAARVLRQAEQAALVQGELLAGDLHRAHAWEIGVAEQRKQLTQRVTTATNTEDAARTHEAAAQQALAQREADAQVVEKDKARFVSRVDRETVAKEEEAAAEAWRPVRRA